MRPLPSTITNSSSRDQNHDNCDTLSQPTPVASMDCFITTESSLMDNDSTQGRAEVIPTVHQYTYTQKPTTNHNMYESDCPWLLPQPAPVPSSAASSNAGQGRSLPPTSVFASSHGSGSANSIPSSPGNLSSVAMSEDGHSLSASLSELPPSHSPVMGTSPILPRGLTPQLVMPSLTVPQRRPFSEIGKSLGKLKVLVTGRRGIGKTSLILAIAQSSAHIVHMDTVVATSNNMATDVYASTRPKPWWRTDLDHDLSRRRRSSTSDQVLDRNICFVDCPVYGDDAQGSSPAVDYVESRLAELAHKSINGPDLRALLSGGAESNVDVVLYLLPHSGPTSDDIRCMRDLQNATNVIPLLARADELSLEERLSAKNRTLRGIDSAGLDCFFFTTPGGAQDHRHIYAISSATQADAEIIDASILMSSDYLPPLVATDLGDLVKNLLSVEGSTWLRHSAACKAIKWMRQQRHRGSLLPSALTCTKLSPFFGLPQVQFTNQTLNQRDRGRIEVASWAEGLRQSLVAERLRQQITQSMSLTRKQLAVTRRSRSSSKPSRTVAPSVTTTHQDPLGLLELVSQLQTGGKLTLELVSSFGILGCVAAWVIRPELMHQWDIKFPPCLCLA
ncbi:Cell division/GTP binding protein, partial [Metarhizium hybridum]